MGDKINKLAINKQFCQVIKIRALVLQWLGEAWALDAKVLFQSRLHVVSSCSVRGDICRLNAPYLYHDCNEQSSSYIFR